MKKFAAVLVLALSLGGCSTLSDVFDGATGGDVTKAKSPSAYHVGQVLVPVVSQVFAIVRQNLF